MTLDPWKSPGLFSAADSAEEAAKDATEEALVHGDDSGTHRDPGEEAEPAKMGQRLLCIGIDQRFQPAKIDI